MTITVAKFNDVADGTQPGQFTIGEREAVSSLNDLDPSFKRLPDEPVTAVVAVMGRDEYPNPTPSGSITRAIPCCSTWPRTHQ